MKDRAELSGLMVELIESVDIQGETMKFPQRATEIVKEISAYAQATGFYRSFRETADNFWPDGTTPEEIYGFILDRIVNAPTTLHRDTAVLGHMPALEKALNGKRGDSGKSTDKQEAEDLGGE